MDKVAYKFDPFELVGVDKPKTGLRQAKQEICEFVRDEILNYVGDGKSPVSGGKWKRSLSPEYKKRKADESSVDFANMELTGDMLDAMQCIVTKDGDLELRIAGKEAGKADGHNNHSGKSKLPAREFIPKADQTFKRDILEGIRDIARSYLDED